MDQLSNRCREQSFSNIPCEILFKIPDAKGEVDHYVEIDLSTWDECVASVINEATQSLGKTQNVEKQSGGQLFDDPRVIMLLTLPSSIKTNDLSSARHGGEEL